MLRCGYAGSKKVLFIPRIIQDQFNKGDIYSVMVRDGIVSLKCISVAGRLVLYIPTALEELFKENERYTLVPYVYRTYNVRSSKEGELTKGENVKTARVKRIKPK